MHYLGCKVNAARKCVGDCGCDENKVREDEPTSQSLILKGGVVAHTERGREKERGREGGRETDTRTQKESPTSQSLILN